MSPFDGAADRAAVAAAVRETVAETGFEPRGSDPLAADDGGGAAGGEGGEAEGVVEDDRPPTAEELAAIDADPEAKRIYRDLKKRFYQKTGTLAQRQKQYEDAQGAMEAIRADPRGAIKLMAEAAGMRLEGEPSIEDEVMAELRQSIGKEAAEVLGPTLVRTIEKLTDRRIEPLTREQQQREAAAGAHAIRHGVSEFGRRVAEDGGEWSEEIEQAMAALVPKFPPGPGATLPDYLEVLHSNVMASRRGRPARGRAPVGRIKAGMDPREAARIAVAQARRDLGR